MLKNTFFFTFVVSVYFSNAQTNPLEVKAKYQQAKFQLKNQSYLEAKKSFEYLQKVNTSSNSPFIQYYIAFCQYKLNDYTGAEKTTFELESKYIDWAENDNFNYLKGLIALKKGNIDNSLSAFNKIKSKTFQKDIENNYYKNIKNEFSEQKSKEYALKYTNLVFLKNNITNQQLKNIYDIPANELPLLPSLSVKTNYNMLNVGVMLPFKLNEARQEIPSNMQYVYDLYDGILLAVDKLKSEGIDAKIHAYEVDNDKEKMISLINNKAFQNENILFGPLHIESNKLAQYYANELKIPLINPISKNTSHLKNKPYCFSANGSNESFIKQASLFYSNNFPGNVAIISDNSPEEKTFSNTLLVELKTKNKLATLVNFTNIESLNSLTNKKLTCIFIASNSKNTNAILNAIDKKIGVIPIICNRESFSKNIKINTNINPELYIFSQDFIDESNENILALKSNFWNNTNGIVSEFTYKGYDLMLYWGRQYYKYKENTIDMLKFRSIDTDYLLSGFNYGIIPNENAAFTITNYQNGAEVLYQK